MKKIVGIIIAVMAIVLIGFSVSRIIQSYTPENENDYSEEISYLNNEVDFKMYLYGDNINFPEEFKYKKLNDLNLGNEELDADYVYLVINDLSGKIKLTDEDVKYLMELTDKYKNFNYFYIGKEKLTLFKKYNKDLDFEDGDLSIGRVVMYGDRLNYYGFWTQYTNNYLDKNPNLLYQDILDEIKKCIESNEKS